MNKLTTEKCRELIQKLNDKQAHPMKGLTGDEKLYLPALEIALPVLEQQEKGSTPQIDNDDWIEWKGGESAPVTGMVEVRWSDGSKDTGNARIWRWSHDSLLSGNRLIAYRVIEQQERERGEEE